MTSIAAAAEEAASDAGISNQPPMNPGFPIGFDLDLYDTQETTRATGVPVEPARTLPVSDDAVWMIKYRFLFRLIIIDATLYWIYSVIFRTLAFLITIAPVVGAFVWIAEIKAKVWAILVLAIWLTVDLSCQIIALVNYYSLWGIPGSLTCAVCILVQAFCIFVLIKFYNFKRRVSLGLPPSTHLLC
ncbi:hypothetical protein Pelo_15516 [Pelomyxa schiedti]|nr:hypothetical protein Pelo_15516 [Pelomyxa schiedti]